MSQFLELLENYKNRKPAIVFEWSDTKTDAQGWVVINSLRGGAAGGGTRMRKGLDKHEVESLAKVMEIKFTVSGPSIGGAKSGINFDPNHPDRDGVLKRWYKAVFPLLKNYYGTGGDLNVDELHDVIPITEDLGLWHPQEGIVNGHFKPRKAEKIHLIGQLRQGVSKKLENPQFTPDIKKGYTVADMITGYGVAESVIHYYDIWHQKQNLEGKKAVIQGFGNVAGATAYYLAQSGAKIVGIIDKDGGIIDNEGLDLKAITKLLKERKGNKLNAKNMLSFQETNEKIWDIEADIFIPAAASRLVSKDQIERMINSGLECISAGANVPFKDQDFFFGETAAFADEKVSLIPDFIANCGMARVFAYLMSKDGVEISDEAIFGDVSDVIRNAFFDVFKESTSKLNISKTALGVALEKIK